MIDGQVVYTSKKELSNFWFLNAVDQQDLTVKFFNKSYSKGKARALIAAYFYTFRRCKIVAVSGSLSLDIDAAGKITRLEQNYEKIERKSFIYSLAYAKRRLLDPAWLAIRRAFRPIWRSISTIVQVSLYVAMWIGVFLVLYSEILHESLKWISDATHEDVKKYTPFWFALAYILQQTIMFVKRKIVHDVHFIPIDGEQDLRLMRKFTEGADNVEIVSGDFSFLDTDSDLQATLKDLAYSKKLHLISYKPEAKVKSEIKVKSAGRDILYKLGQDNAISYDFPVTAKITIVSHGRNRKMLLRYWRDEDGEQRRYMGVVRETANTGALLDLVTNLIAKAKT